MTRRTPAQQPEPIEHRPLWTVQQVAEFLNIGVYKAGSMARAGQLPVHHIGRLVRFIPAEIERYVERAL